jgi:entericidin A
MARKIALLALVASVSLLAACNTVKGLGRDIESVGNAGEKAINK